MKTIAVPTWAMDDDLIIRLINTITAVDNETGTRTVDTVDCLMAELDGRATTRYRLDGNKIVRLK